MARQLGPPMLLLSTRASSLLRLEGYLAAVDEADLDGIDLDATNDVRRTVIASRSMTKLLANPSIESLWLRPLQLEASGLRPFRDFAAASGSERLPLVVIDVPAGVDPVDALKIQIEAAGRLRSAIGHDTSIAIAIRAQNHEGSRDHLDRLNMVRHQVSEWDLRLALDLTTRTDGTWEAEAAINRILPRLSMIRLTVPRTLLSGGVRWRIASRVVAAATDGGFRGLISVSPELSFWEKRSINTLADRSATFATNLERRAIRVRGERHRSPGRRQLH